MRSPFTLAALLAASLSQAQFLISELSFGHAGRISPPEAHGQIPNFVYNGEPNTPELLSNRVILTPLAPGNQRGAIWSQQPLQRDEWIADVDFRTNGPERGSGIFNIWLAKDGKNSIGSNSIYTVGGFEGLALVLDAPGGSSGMLRAFLNDGSVAHNHRTNVDELAFGHCPYGYRNLGRPSQIKFRQTHTSFRVEVDGSLCFETDKVKIPQGYYLGVTASTPDTPDSFEVFKVVVMAENNEFIDDHAPPPHHDAPVPPPVPPPHFEDYDFFAEDQPDQSADIFITSKEQFVDLHNRLQSTNHQISAAHRLMAKHQQADDKRHDEVTRLLHDMAVDMRKLDKFGDQFSDLVRRTSDIEAEIRSMRTEMNRKLLASERSVKNVLSDHHTTLAQAVIEATPGHSRLIIVFVCCQLLLVGAYFAYKHRRNSMPKKYL